MLAPIGIQPSQRSRIINLAKDSISQNPEKSSGTDTQTLPLIATNFEHKLEAVTEAMDSEESNRSVTTSIANTISKDVSIVNNHSMWKASDDCKNCYSIKLTQKSQCVLDETEA